MAFSFPSNPTVGQQVIGPNGFTYLWDGKGWVTLGGETFVPFSGGTMTGPLALYGVTDGSDAQPGEVGEYMQQGRLQTDQLALAGGVVYSVVDLTLTPGDWDVWGYISFFGGTSPTLSAAINDNAAQGMQANPFFRFDVPSGVSGLGISGALPMRRFSSTWPMNPLLRAAATYTVGQAYAWGSIHARRIR